jgi:hypothetical protein
MLTAILIVLVGLLGLAIGYFSRETKETLRRIEAALKVLVQRKDKVEAQEIAKKKGMTFGSPMTMSELAEMEEQERIDVLNANM